MKCFRRLTGFLVILAFLFGLIGCSPDPTGPVASEADQQVNENQLSKKQERNKSADDLKGKKAESDKSTQDDPGDEDETTDESKDSSTSDNTTGKQHDTEQNSEANQVNANDSENQASDRNQTSANDRSVSGNKEKDSQKDQSSETEQSAGNSKKDEQTEQNTDPQETVTVTITSNGSKGTIVGTTAVTIEEGDNLLDATLSILKQRGIQYSVRGSNASAYVEGIDNLYEFDRGPLSGWIVQKNGVYIDQSAGIEPIKSGDTINWTYTLDYTKEENLREDVGN